jgi:hypothetical protein
MRIDTPLYRAIIDIYMHIFPPIFCLVSFWDKIVAQFLQILVISLFTSLITRSIIIKLDSRHVSPH